MKLQTYTLQSLKAFAESPIYQQMPIQPISKHRLNSYAHNPNLNPTAIIAVLVFEDNKMIAYRTLLSDSFELEGIKENFAWLSGIWVNPQYRGRGIARLIMKETFSLWGDALSSVDHAPASRHLYLSTGKMSELAIKGRRYYRKFCLERLLGNRNKYFNTIKGFFRFFDSKANCILDWRYASKIPTISAPYTSKIIKANELDEVQLLAFQKDFTFKKNKAYFEWLLHYPWMQKGQKSKQYHFSDFAPDFEQCLMAIYNENNELCGYILISKKNGLVKIPFFLTSPKHEQKIAKYLLKLVDYWRADYFTIYDNRLISIFNRHFITFLFSKKVMRYFISTKRLHSKLKKQDKKFHDGDGDTAFV